MPPEDFDRLISEYRLTQTASLGDPYCASRGFLPPYVGIPPYIGMPPYSDRLIGRPLLYLQRIFAALNRDAASLRPPYWGTPTVPPEDFYRLMSGCRLTQTGLLGDPCCCTAISNGYILWCCPAAVLLIVKFYGAALLLYY